MDNKLIYKLLRTIASKIESKTINELGVAHRKIDGEYFENVFTKYYLEAVESNEFKELNLELEDLRGHKFPDFSINFNGLKFGVEIKSSEKGTWTIPGNTVYENISTINFENIFVFFGSYKKNKDAFEVVVTEYWKAVKDIKVTHSPRFEISVNPAIKTDFFADWKSFVDFKNMKKSEKTKYLQEFLRQKKKGQNLWYVPNEENEETEQSNPMLFEKLNKSIQYEILAKCFILFSKDIFRAKRTEKSGIYTMDSYYGNIANYLLEEHFIISSSLRDRFSSGGKKVLEFNENEYTFPAVFTRFSNLGDLIANILTEVDEGTQAEFKEIIEFYWNDNNVEYDESNFLQSYLKQLHNIENTPNLQYVIRTEMKVEDDTSLLSNQIHIPK